VEFFGLAEQLPAFFKSLFVPWNCFVGGCLVIYLVIFTRVLILFEFQYFVSENRVS